VDFLGGSGDYGRSLRHLTELDPILNVEDWHLLAQSMGMPFKPENMEVLISYLNGKPNEIMKAFQAQARIWGQWRWLKPSLTTRSPQGTLAEAFIRYPERYIFLRDTRVG
jgi:hypothetical protein